MGEATVPTGLPPRLRTEGLRVHQELLMAVMEPRVTEGNTGTLPVGIMGVTEDSLMEDPMDTMPRQVTFLLALTRRRTSGSILLTRTTAASSTSRS